MSPSTTAPTDGTQFQPVRKERSATTWQAPARSWCSSPGWATYEAPTGSWPRPCQAGYRVASTDLRGHGDSDATFTSYGDVETAGDLLP